MDYIFAFTHAQMGFDQLKKPGGFWVLLEGSMARNAGESFLFLSEPNQSL